MNYSANGLVSKALSVDSGRRYLKLKRVVDVVGASAALLFFAPFLLLVAAAIVMADGFPVFYRHERVGRDGRIFGCLKFRSMVRDSDKRLAEHLASDPEARAEWSRTRKLRNDPRIIPIGRFLRKTSLDELPQLINVLRGDMSLVGPRPVVADELYSYYDDEGRRAYCSLRPGITGLWQVSGRSDVDYVQRVALDSQYANSYSMGGDIVIVMRTLGVLLWRTGAY